MPVEQAEGLTPLPEGTDSLLPPASQLKKLDLAAAAAHTFFVANPTHLQMREDMAKYRRMSRVRPQSFRDLETPPHWVRHFGGIHQAYWTGTCVAQASQDLGTVLGNPRWKIPLWDLVFFLRITKVPCSTILVLRPTLSSPR